MKHKSFPNSYCGVITQRRAFSWYLYLEREMPEDPLDWMAYVSSKFSDNLIERRALSKAFAISREHYDTDPDDRTDGAIYYMTTAGLRNIVRHIKQHSEVKRVGAHLFFNDIEWR